MEVISNMIPQSDYNAEGKPLRLHELDIEGLSKFLHEKRVRTSQGKLFQPLFQTQVEIVKDPARFKVLACGRRFGKTLLASLMALAALFQIRRRIWICAPDYSLCEKVFRELQNILVVQLQVIKPGKPGGGRCRSQKGDYYLETPWGSVLEAKSLENPDSLAGEANDLVIIDEAAINEQIEDIWTQMIQPTLMDKEGSAIFISTPRGRNSFYKLYLYGKKGTKQRQGKLPVQFDEELGIDDDMTEWSAFRSTSYDNPLLAGTPEKSKEEVDRAYKRAVHSGKVVKFKQEYLADFEAVADIVFPGFIMEAEKKYPVPNVVDYAWHPNEGPIYAACDHNFAKPASTIFAQVNKFGDVIIFDERFTSRTSTYEQAQQISDKELELNKTANNIWNIEKAPMSVRHRIKFEHIVADISGKQRQLNGRSAWDDFKEVLKRSPVGLKQDREIGCNMVRQWLQFPKFDSKGRPIVDENNDQVTYPKLFISSNCPNLTYAMSTAKFKKTKAGALKEDYEESPDGYEGLLDALRYLLIYLFHDTGEHFTVTGGF